MDIVDDRYFDINKRLLTLIGLWPEDSKAKFYVRPCFMVLMVILTTPQLCSAIVHYDEIERMIFNVLAYLTGMVVILKAVALTISDSKIKDLLSTIKTNWRTIRDGNEREILAAYSERARRVTIFYTEKHIPFSLDAIVIYCVSLTTIAIDGMYFAVREHCCAMNAIISYHLRSLGENLPGGSSNSDDDAYKKLINIVLLHKKAVGFTTSLNDTYSLNYVFIMTANLIIIPLNGCAIIANLDDIIQVCPYIALFGGMTLHLFVIFCPGQRVLDHNLNLCDHAYCNQWYVTSPRTKKLLLIFMLRCNQPTVLSAGGFFLVNFEMYSSVMRTALSYITVLASFR